LCGGEGGLSGRRQNCVKLQRPVVSREGPKGCAATARGRAVLGPKPRKRESGREKRVGLGRLGMSREEHPNSIYRQHAPWQQYLHVIAGDFGRVQAPAHTFVPCRGAEEKEEGQGSLGKLSAGKNRLGAVYMSSEHLTRFRKRCQTRKGRWVTLMIFLGILVLGLQIFLLTRMCALPSSVLQTICREGGLWSEGSASRHVGILSGGSRNHKPQSPVPRDSSGFLASLEMVAKPKSFPSTEEFGDTGKLAFTRVNLNYTVTRLGYGKPKVAHDYSMPTPPALPPISSHVNEAVQENLVHSNDIVLCTSSNKAEELTPKSNSSHMNPVPSSFPAPVHHVAVSTDLSMVQRRNDGIRPISEMKNLLFRNRAIPRLMVRLALSPRWSLAPDQEMLDAKWEIDKAPTVKNDPELYAPAFWNFSTFKRSYELMEKTLKVYIYREGQKPIFHRPVLDGIYASEGWFMKQIEENTKFVVKDPGKAHLFYMPFCSSALRFSLYVPGPHAKRHLLQYLNNYTHVISTKYPFWNRTGGADHFLVACHDWALYVTKGRVRHCIRVLCDSDISEGFELGKDIPLPEANVLTAQNPVRDIGGRDATRRRFLSFFAGKMHGHVRPILLKHWENKDPDIRILGRFSCGVQCKTTSARYMKNSKYCICPSGYRAFSPRVVEAIRYECVPVIISDNYVPPFFDVLNWEAFSVRVAERDIAMLKDILLSIPKKKYISLQMGVRRVQKHFLLHTKPVKYDMFHMILHSVWFSRLSQMRIEYLFHMILHSDFGIRCKIPNAVFPNFKNPNSHFPFPLARRFTGRESGITPLQRIGVGLFTVTFSMVVAALVEGRRRRLALGPAGERLPIMWIAPQFLIFGLSEMFTAVGLIEFFYKQSLAGMQSFLTAMTYCSYSFGFYLSSILVSLVNRITSSGGGWLSDNDLNKDRLDLFYWMLAALSLLNFFNYLFWSRWYSYHPRLCPSPQQQTMVVKGGDVEHGHSFGSSKQVELIAVDINNNMNIPV
ncbi:hypothetical protein Taro_049399, partial [Colocasia esculenta]|nr:hypothetical protein [Colocasia esculenta]